MDEATIRNRIIEEQYPDGKAQSGFSYSFSKLNVPKNMIALEIKMPTETLRLFFSIADFREFGHAAKVVTDLLGDVS